MKISEKRLRQIVAEEVKLTESVDHSAIKDIVSKASELLSAISDFKEEATPALINAVTPCLSDLENALESMVSNPGSFVSAPKREPKKVSLKPEKTKI